MKWNDFESKDARIRASLPCTPNTSEKEFQYQPRPIAIYSFDCETDGIRFLLGAKNHQNAFNSKTTDESFDSNEFLLRSMFGEVEKLGVRKNFTTNEFPSREYDIELKADGKIRALIVVNEFATYQAMIGIALDRNDLTAQKKLVFKDISETFLRSVEILKQ